jgi:Spy/CpxP family protein refolding chaperone
MRRSWIVLALGLCTLVPSTVAAQRVQERREIDRAQLEERVRAQMGRLMRERLGLDEAGAERLSEVVRGFDGRRRALFAEEQTTRRSVETVLRDGANDENEARELITRMWELRQEEAALFREEQEALLDVLTPVQVLRLQELRQDLGQRIRALGGGRGGRPPVAPGAGPSRGPGPGSRGRQGAVRAPGTDAQPLL